MEILVKASQFFLSLSILVILHELGHYIFARAFNTRVEKFYLFFNPWFSLFKIKKGDTEYGIGWLPLGGYVKISGMIDESMDKEQLSQPPQPYEFRSKPSWQRLLIMMGGVLVNFVLALVIYSGILFVWGEQYLPNESVKYGIVCDTLALESGLQNGDKIISLDGKKPESFSEIVPNIVLNNVKVIEVDRDGNRVDVPLPDDLVSKLIKSHSFISPRIPFVVGDFTRESAGKTAGLERGDRVIAINDEPVMFFDEVRAELAQNKNQEIRLRVQRQSNEMELSVLVPESGLIGISGGALADFFELKNNEYNFLEAIPAGIKKGYRTMQDYLKQFKLLFSPKTKAYESLGGFITIGNIFPGQWDWQSFWSLTAFLSIILAIMNMLPIPALDGGHVMFLLFEMITGRKPGDKFMEYAQIAGMVLLFSLLIYANGNDIIRLFK